MLKSFNEWQDMRKSPQELAVEKVREELPDVRVQLPDGKVVMGMVRGRQNPFATVVIKHFGNKDYIRYEAAWTTLAYCVQNNLPLKV